MKWKEPVLGHLQPFDVPLLEGYLVAIVVLKAIGLRHQGPEAIRF